MSAITFLELAVLLGQGSTRSKFPVNELLSEVKSNSMIEVEPFTVDVAVEVAGIGPSLRDPSDRAIVCTARLRKLRLLTSDRRIVESNLVSVVE
ncbi:MAG TPA: PIN domain-containing protein [Bryobacteraceae bacterium]|nr:PIN domain-containing protein [Bryobacteraceae bacterium]